MWIGLQMEIAYSRWVKHVILYVDREYNWYMWKMQMDMKLELIWWLIMVNGYTCWNIMNDMDYEYNDGYENDYGIHIWS